MHATGKQLSNTKTTAAIKRKDILLQISFKQTQRHTNTTATITKNTNRTDNAKSKRWQPAEKTRTTILGNCHASFNWILWKLSIRFFHDFFLQQRI